MPLPRDPGPPPNAPAGHTDGRRGRSRLPASPLFLLVIFAAPLAADAQPPPKLARIGFLMGGSPSTSAPLLLVFPDAVAFAHRTRIVDLVAKYRLPAMYGARDMVEAGGLMAYGSSLIDLFRRAAPYVDKILKGAKPGDLPVEQTARFELVLNLKTAKALGLTIPQSILIRAD